MGPILIYQRGYSLGHLVTISPFEQPCELGSSLPLSSHDCKSGAPIGPTYVRPFEGLHASLLRFWTMRYICSRFVD